MQTILLTPSEIEIVKEHAKKTCLGGQSQIYSTRTPEELYEHQYIMHRGEAALSKYLSKNLDWYIRTRAEKDKDENRWNSDNGSDLLGTRIDVKTSKIRTSLQPLMHHLYVRDKEYHKDVAYILALIPRDNDNKVVMVAWIGGDYLPPSVNGRREILASEMYPIESFYDPDPYVYEYIQEGLEMMK